MRKHTNIRHIFQVFSEGLVSVEGDSRSQHHWPAPQPVASRETPAVKPLQRHSETQTQRHINLKTLILLLGAYYLANTSYLHTNTFPERRKHLRDAMFHCPLSGGGAVMPALSTNQRAHCIIRTGNAMTAANQCSWIVTDRKLPSDCHWASKGKRKILL